MEGRSLYKGSQYPFFGILNIGFYNSRNPYCNKEYNIKDTQNK